MVIVGKKKWLIVAACLLVIVVAANMMLDREETQNTPNSQDTANKAPDIQEQSDSWTSSASEQDNFFSEYRMERERLRGKQIEMMRELLGNPAADQKAREAASLRLVKITEDMEKEMKAEGLVKSKSIDDCVVIIQPQCTTVVVQASNLRLDQEEEIKKLVSGAIQCSEEDLALIIRDKP